MHHFSFEVNDFDTQLIGHEYMLGKGYKAVWGVGRHILKSQIFDYWKDTSYFTIEHYAVGDLVHVDTPTTHQEALLEMSDPTILYYILPLITSLSTLVYDMRYFSHL
jgi:hypothetical protein